MECCQNIQAAPLDPMLNPDIHRRINYKHFKQDQYPFKETIETVIQEGIDLSCMSREYLPHWRIEIYGPEHFEDKKKLVLESGSKNQTPKAAGYNCMFHPHAKKVGVEQWEKDITKVYEEHPGTFNRQILAPYFCHLITDPATRVHHQTKLGRNTFFLELGNMLHSIASVANAYEVDFSFCRCYTNYRDNPIMRGIDPDEVLVTSFALGYYDWSLAGSKGYECYWSKTDDPDVIENKKGGLYNIKDCTRVNKSHKTLKPKISELV